MKNDDGDDEEDEGSSFETTPSKKKTPLNKVQGGRVQKSSARSRAAAPAPGAFAELSENEDEGDVKEELMDDGSDEYQVHNNGYSNGHSNGHGFANDDMNVYGHEEEGVEQQYYDVQEEA
jgi:hypothetical protein